jgi:Flp pilus assembly protein TadD
VRTAPAWLLAAGIAAAGSTVLLRAFGPQQLPPPAGLPTLTVDYPADGSVFPPDITPPTFLWRDPAAAAKSWRIEIAFAEGAALRIVARGEPMRLGEVDDSYGGYVPPSLTAEESAAHTWTPDAATWTEIQSRSIGRPAAIRIFGCADPDCARPLSRGQVVVASSPDPVGAPILYRDVPLLPAVPEGERGIIKPLPDSLLPLIRWRLRYLDEPRSRTVMENLPTCANCHSVSRDGKTLGLDVDGPANNKALYGLLPLRKVSSIDKQSVVQWSRFTDGSAQRFGFMSQVSPDGKYVVTSVEVPGARDRHLGDRLFQANFPEFRFVQVFYPTRGILAWYSRESGRLQPLPGADDPRYVQACAFWSPDGSYLVFSRAEARDPYPAGRPAPRFANDPNEPQIQYDLYRIPFREGRGGTPERIVGASGNGMSNNFPKVSPDGKWIVFVQNRNGLLMRPDSQLYIVPAAGGTARRLRANLSLMNSWHSFSPNGRWLVFSSKGRTPYTRLFLTHIDDNGNDSPAIPIDATTAANRAANIPEFVNIPKGGLDRIEAPATDFYRLFNTAIDLMKRNRFADAVATWRQAMALEDDDAKAHYNLGYALSETGDLPAAIREYRRSAALDPSQPPVFANLALACAETGDLDGAVANYRTALALDPSNAMVEADLGAVLVERGRTVDGLDRLRHAASAQPQLAEIHNKLAAALGKAGQFSEAVPELETAVRLAPDSVEYRFNLGYVLGLSNRLPEAVAQLEKASELSGGRDWRCFEMLAGLYFGLSRPADAAAAARKALDLSAAAENDPQLTEALRSRLARYL